MAVMSSEGCLVYVVVMYSDLVVARLKVQFGENCGAMQFIKKLINDRDRVLIFDCNGVKSSIVDAETPAAILFLHE